MPAYMVAEVDWHDQGALAKYVQGHSELLAKYGGEILVATEDVETIEGKWRPRLLGIIRFPSKRDFHAWYSSGEYAPRLALRLKHADSKVALIGDPE